MKKLLLTLTIVACATLAQAEDNKATKSKAPATKAQAKSACCMETKVADAKECSDSKSCCAEMKPACSAMKVTKVLMSPKAASEAGI